MNTRIVGKVPPCEIGGAKASPDKAIDRLQFARQHCDGRAARRSVEMVERKPQHALVKLVAQSAKHVLAYLPVSRYVKLEPTMIKIKAREAPTAEGGVQDPVLGAAAVAFYPWQGCLIPKRQRIMRRLGCERVQKMRRLSERIGETIAARREILANHRAPYQLADIANRLGKFMTSGSRSITESSLLNF
jgi:hypothetical protein